MELTGDRFEKLYAAILEACPGEASLKRTVRFELDIRLNELAEGSNHSDRVFDFIDKLLSESKVTDLIRGVHRASPGSKRLRQFCQDYQQALLIDACQENSSSLDTDTIQIFVELLPTIPIDAAIEAGQAVLPLGAGDDASDKDMKDFSSPDLEGVMRLFGLLRLVLSKFPKTGEPKIPTLLRFAQQIALALTNDDDAREPLVKWIEQAEAALGIFSRSESVQPVALQPKGTLDVSLMLTVRRLTQPDRKPPQYRMNGYLYFDQIVGDDSAASPVRPFMTLSVPEAQDQVGIVCSWNDMPKWTKQFLDIANEQLSHSLKQELRYRAYRLMTEVFLPMDSIGEKIDQWPILSEQELEPLGKNHGVIVRFCDRLDNDRHRNGIYLAWDEIGQLLENSQSADALQQYIESPNTFKQYGSWRKLELALREKFVLKLCCGLPETPAEQKGLFKAILMGDIPVAAWTRSTELIQPGSDETPPPPLDIADALAAFLVTDWFHSPVAVAEQLNSVRYQAWAEAEGNNAGKCLGDHLAFLLDNPDRMPDPSLLTS